LLAGVAQATCSADQSIRSVSRTVRPRR
jgi:hypothetical protein